MKFEHLVTVSVKRYDMHARLDSRRPRQDTALMTFAAEYHSSLTHPCTGAIGGASSNLPMFRDWNFH